MNLGLKSTLFKRQLTFTVVVTVGFITIALIAAFLAAQFDREKFGPRPALFYANMIDEIVTQQKISPEQALEVMQKANSNSLPYTMRLADKDHLPSDVDLFTPPDHEEYDPKAHEANDSQNHPHAGQHVGSPDDGRDFPRPPGGPDIGFFGGPPGGPMGAPMGPPPDMPPPDGMPGDNFKFPLMRHVVHFGLGGGRRGGPPHTLAVGLRSDPKMFLVLDFSGNKGMLSPRERILMYNFVALVIAVILASAISLFALFYNMRSKARLAAKIIGEIKSGNLNARFPIGRADEVGQLMIEFNRMADDIEGLIQQLKAKEQGRMALLQELAHDLRTPVASMRNLLETMHNRRESIKPEVRDELMALSLKEVDYFGRLIEDLLVWAQVTEPTYFTAQHEVDLNATIEEEIDSASVSLAAGDKKLKVIKDLESTPILLKADPHLMRRMLRNAFGNAFSFARKTVMISAHSEENEIVISVRDDGPGLSPEAQTNFGEKRMTRSFGGQLQDGRLSLGLGSLIMKSIAQLHRGQVSVRNASPTNEVDNINGESTSGAIVTIRLPKV